MQESRSGEKQMAALDDLVGIEHDGFGIGMELNRIELSGEYACLVQPAQCTYTLCT